MPPADPGLEQRQTVVSMLLLSLFIGVPLFMVYRRAKR